MKAQLKQHNGTPTVFVEDKPAFFGCHLVEGMHPDRLNEHQPYARKYAETEVHIYSVDTLTQEGVGPRPDDPGPYDFSLVVSGLQGYIDVGYPRIGGTIPIRMKSRSCPTTHVGGSFSRRASGEIRSMIWWRLL